MISLVWNLRNKGGKKKTDKPSTKLLTIESKLMVPEGKWGLGGGMGE